MSITSALISVWSAISMSRFIFLALCAAKRFTYNARTTGNSLSTSIGATLLFTTVPAPAPVSARLGGATAPPLVVLTAPARGADAESDLAAAEAAPGPPTPDEPPWPLRASAPARSDAAVQPASRSAASGTTGIRTRRWDERRNGTGGSRNGDDEMY